MSKEELFKKYQEILLKTNGRIDDYVVALCQISDLIKDYAEEKDQQITDLQKQLADLEAKLAESEKSKESYRLQNEHHHLQLLQFYSRLGVEAFGADIHEKALETLMLMKEEIEEKNGVRRALSACNRQNDEFADMIKKLVNEKEELKQQLHDLLNKIVEEITNELSNNTSLYFEIRESTSAHCPNKEYEWFNYVRFRNYINTILKKFGGEDE